MVVWKGNSEIILVIGLVNVDTSLEERALLRNTDVDGGAHQWLQSEIPGRSRISNPNRQHSIDFNPRPVFLQCVCFGEVLGFFRCPCSVCWGFQSLLPGAFLWHPWYPWSDWAQAASAGSGHGVVAGSAGLCFSTRTWAGLAVWLGTCCTWVNMSVCALLTSLVS